MPAFTFQYVFLKFKQAPILVNNLLYNGSIFASFGKPVKMDAITAKKMLEDKIKALVQEFTDVTDLHIEQIQVISQINRFNKRVITRIRALLDSEGLAAALE